GRIMLMVFISKDTKALNTLPGNLKDGVVILNRFSYKISEKNPSIKMSIKQKQRFNTIFFNLDTKDILLYGKKLDDTYYCRYKKLKTSRLYLSILFISFLVFIYFIYLSIITQNIYISMIALLAIILVLAYSRPKIYATLALKN
ncbi:MAG: hypothetical protein ACRC41_09780, partial [Sarcina sp.]